MVLLLVAVGALFVGWQVFQAAGDLYTFATKSVNAKNDADLTEAGRAFAEAVTLIGIAVVTAVLTRGAVKKLGPKISPRSGENVFYKPTTVKVPLRPGLLGSTSKFGDITLSTRISGPLELETLLHERIRSALSPKFWFLRNARARLGEWAYDNVALLRYLEEAIAETYAQCRTKGVNAESLLTGLKFPFDEKYLTVTRAAVEIAGGTLIGCFTWRGIRHAVYQTAD
ncbi:MAG: hypothetical protein NTW28_24840 [Candidatus Solibacter sp.]|nr:hypothetical protein [Candidatus Solibacter sp.]